VVDLDLDRGLVGHGRAAQHVVVHLQDDLGARLDLEAGPERVVAARAAGRPRTHPTAKTLPARAAKAGVTRVRIGGVELLVLGHLVGRRQKRDHVVHGGRWWAMRGLPGAARKPVPYLVVVAGQSSRKHRYSSGVILGV